MKKTLSLTLLVLSYLILVVSLFFCIYSICDINCVLDELANTPSASGIDYWGIGWGYGIVLFTASAFGLILSGISRKLLQPRKLQHISIAAMVIFALLFVTSFFVFYM